MPVPDASLLLAAAAVLTGLSNVIWSIRRRR
jgi:hypothetical protein